MIQYRVDKCNIFLSVLCIEESGLTQPLVGSGANAISAFDRAGILRTYTHTLEQLYTFTVQACKSNVFITVQV